MLRSLPLSLCLFGLALSLPGAPLYSVVSLGVLSGDSSSGANAINALGQVTGYSTGPGGSRIFFWNGTSMQDLGTLGGTVGEGSSINNAGQITGMSTTAAGEMRAVLWDGTSLVNLGTLNSGSGSWGTGINNSGTVTGWSWTPDPTNSAVQVQRAFRSTGGPLSEVTPAPIAPPGFSVHSFGWGINDAGAIAGESAGRAVIWSGGTVQDLGIAGIAYAINNNGWAAGSRSDGQTFLWNGSSVQLLGATGALWGYGINSSGQVVGRSINRAFLYDNGTLHDLNTLLVNGTNWTLLGARGINDAGQIVGTANFNGQTVAFLASPVPEPSSLALMALGAAALLLRQKRR